MVYVDSITLDPKEMTIPVGGWYNGPKVTISPANATKKSVTWLGSDDTVAVVNSSTGMVFGNEVGEIRVYAKAKDGSGANDYYTLIVCPRIPVTSITLSATEVCMERDQSFILHATVKPDNATDKTLHWSSNNSYVATVENGVVTTHNSGTATIAAMPRDGGNVIAVCTVRVTEDGSVDNQYILENGWLRLYTRPTVSCSGRVVNIPVVNSFTGSDGFLYQFTNKNYWYSYENPYTHCGYINPNAQNRITALGKTVTVNIGSCGEYTDENGRYWMAVGPNVVNPSHTGGQAITPTEMYGTGVLDIVVKDSSGKKYYIPAVVGDAKAHTWNNGVIQTYKAYPNGNFASAGMNYNGTVTAEFIGNLKGKLSGLEKYSIDSIVFYAD